MFKRSSSRLGYSLLRSRAQVCVKASLGNSGVLLKRFVSTEPEKVFSKITDENDSQREGIFKYSWGSWLVNNEFEREKRTTRFSIEGLSSVVNDLYKDVMNFKTDASKKLIFKPNSTVTLADNASAALLDRLNAKEGLVQIKTIASIHEGKHHRIYKISTSVPSESFILRIPYTKIDQTATDYIPNRIKSEVATMDFIANKAKNLTIPKVYSYSTTPENPLKWPYILEEYIEGDLLMKKWDPLVDDDPNGKPPSDKLKNIIDIVADLHKEINSIKFETKDILGGGSIYFKDDIDPKLTTGSIIDDKWVIGPVMERAFWRKKESMKGIKSEFLGPWNKIGSEMDLVKNLGAIELENAKIRLLETADSELKEMINGQVQSFENLIKLAPKLFSSSNSKIPNIKDLLRPTLFHPDLDPMNIIVNKTTGKRVLLDFEGSVIKPFILQSSPRFVEYNGPKIYNIKNDVPDFEKMNENEKAQYLFIYKRTRNEYLWENALNERLPTLITSMAPPIKLLRSPYIFAAERKTEDGYLLIDESLIQLKQVWSELFKHRLVQSKDIPITMTDEQIKKHVQDMNKLNDKLMKNPFAATQGWIPQDMFDNLLKAGMLVKDKDGNYTTKLVK
ncbi:hypothetical protein KAFR_0L01100 [Kazachstania africana CBS 2517]|uniref:Altered inheritance of mitochondria protein 9, mitochondrial n=1 Tax=Kazachstania africana (strain ATCC 22294 / BCRC 22015 / CBS 2517 / CECT 1963 / NBRC 1671 / NRRL Y-8276) TaxID=1071382 RepID=H2B268_KAZAF|nr:hypothetical protein KAFR_0L01100 [Kazachstania africana CBS 2517]CCF60718.1 hypothetical protein KAFR_0L01100 [Kazachstania africana CBS 2517]